MPSVSMSACGWPQSSWPFMVGLGQALLKSRAGSKHMDRHPPPSVSSCISPSLPGSYPQVLERVPPPCTPEMMLCCQHHSHLLGSGDPRARLVPGSVYREHQMLQPWNLLLFGSLRLRVGLSVFLGDHTVPCISAIRERRHMIGKERGDVIRKAAQILCIQPRCPWSISLGGLSVIGTQCERQVKASQFEIFLLTIGIKKPCKFCGVGVGG